MSWIEYVKGFRSHNTASVVITSDALAIGDSYVQFAICSHLRCDIHGVDGLGICDAGIHFVINSALTVMISTSA